jgi:short-subunit dehydrogenase
MARNAILFGAGPALGLHVGRRLAVEGFTLHLVGRTPDRVADTAAALRGFGAPVTEHIVDLADTAAATRLAGELRRLLPLNLLTPLNIVREFVPAMRARGGGAVVVAHGESATVSVPAPALASVSIAQAALVRYLVDLHAALHTEQSGVRIASLQIRGLIEGSAAAADFDAGYFADVETRPLRRVPPEALAEIVWRIVLGEEKLPEVRA